MRESNQTELRLTGAAARAKRGYNAMLGLVLRGIIAGHQDERGRWFVDEQSLESFLRKERTMEATAA